MSSTRRKSAASRARARKRFLIAGLAAFLIIDIGLVAFALNRPRVEPEAAPDRPVSAAQGETAVPTPAAEAAPPATDIPQALTPTRVLAARDGTLAWRATTGPCGAPALPELTTDAGATWKATTATGPTGVVSLQSIVIEGQQVASMIGQDAADCSTTLVRTFVAGDNYAEYPADLGENWFVNPLDRARLHSPAGDAAAPCADLSSLAPRSAAAAAALCSDGTVFSTSDGAATWNAVPGPRGIMSVTSDAEGYLYAQVGDDSCAGVRVGFFDETSTGTGGAPGACIPNALTPAALAGNIALAEGDNAVWMWAGDVTVRSLDGGVTWE